jgi:nitric oxide dioxygenase
MVDLRKVSEAVLKPDADYYVCGPLPFMRQQVETLKALGIKESRVHYEVFGTDVFEE